MHYYYITGTGKGIGRALAEKLLDKANVQVAGFSRTNDISHPGFRFIPMDLEDTEALGDFTFPAHPDAASISLVNNAGTLGEVGRVGTLSNSRVKTAITVNLIAPAILTNNFIAAYRDSTCERTVLNISSGAAATPVDGWSSYCSSKAALDMFTRVTARELELDKVPVRVLSVYPGVVDTAMQGEIRSADRKGFSRLDDFIAYKSNKELKSPEEVAEKLISIVFESRDTINTVFSLRDF